MIGEAYRAALSLSCRRIYSFNYNILIIIFYIMFMVYEHNKPGVPQLIRCNVNCEADLPLNSGMRPSDYNLLR